MNAPAIAPEFSRVFAGHALLIATVRRGARSDELILAAEMDPRRMQAAKALIAWLHEWREIARVAVARRDYRVSLGLAQRKQAVSDEPDEPPSATPKAVTASDAPRDHQQT